MNKFGLLFASMLFVSEAFAQAAAGGPPQSPGEALMRTLPMLGIVFLIFYFLVFRPQQKKLNAQAELLGGLKKGDSVVTSSGIIGRVAGVEKDHILLEIANNVRVKFERSHIVKREEKEAA